MQAMVLAATLWAAASGAVPASEQRRAVEAFVSDSAVAVALKDRQAIHGLKRREAQVTLVSGVCSQQSCSHDYLVLVPFEPTQEGVQPSSVAALVTFPERFDGKGRGAPSVVMIGFAPVPTPDTGTTASSAR
jgi:hypothetical protein